MKKLVFLALLAPSVLFSQEDSTENSRRKFIRVVSISGMLGGEFYREGFSDRTPFQQATPNSTLAFANIGGYGNSNGIFYYLNSRASTNSAMNVNLKLRGQKMSEVRFGLYHSNTSFAAQSYSRETTTPIDTTMLPGGELLYTDSVSYASYDYTWDASVINLHIGWIVRSNPGNWVSVYTGFGLFGGIGFNGILEYNHVHSSRHTHRSPGNNTYYTTNHTTEVQSRETYRAPVFASFGGYIPIGMNIRLAQRNNFFKHIALFGEYQGAVQVLAPKGIDSKIRTVSSMYGGVRYYIHAPKPPKREGRGRHNHRDRYLNDHQRDHN
jgi:hypothetical protein